MGDAPRSVLAVVQYPGRPVLHRGAEPLHGLGKRHDLSHNLIRKTATTIMFGTADNGDDGGRSRGGDHDYGRGDEHEHHHRRRHEARLISGDSCQQHPPKMLLH